MAFFSVQKKTLNINQVALSEQEIDINWNKILVTEKHI